MALCRNKRLLDLSADEPRPGKRLFGSLNRFRIIAKISRPMSLHHNGLRIALWFCFFGISLSLLWAQSLQPEYGKCGYYPDAHQGKKTASGELYDKDQFTASHKSHPFGTLLRVTRLDNKKSVKVRVNDRGPFINGYVVDLSRKAAEAIGLTRDGVAKVKVEVIGTTSNIPAHAEPTVPAAERRAEPARQQAATMAKGASSASEAATRLAVPGVAPVGPSPATYSAASSAKPQAQQAITPSSYKVSVSELYQIEIKTVPPRSFGIQLLVLTSTDNLFKEIKKLQGIWPQKVIVSHEKTGVSATFKLILGPFTSRKEAEAQQKAAQKKGYARTFIVEFE
jgi:rare lipoprotein A